jgi:hypothetical protein
MNNTTQVIDAAALLEPVAMLAIEAGARILEVYNRD